MFLYIYAVKYLQTVTSLSEDFFSLSNVKVYLIRIKLVLPMLSQALTILSQLSNCLLIESVELSYWENDSEVDPTDLIKSSMNSFTKKVGIIKKLNVSLKTSKS